MAAILRDHADEYRSTHCLTPEQSRLLARVERCRTAALGGHLYVCPECGFEQPHYNGCRHRGCPNCQALAQARWIQERERRLLPVGHHHVVFTLPGQLRPLARTHARAVFDAFFWAIRDTFTTLAADVFDGHFGCIGFDVLFNACGDDRGPGVVRMEGGLRFSIRTDDF